MYTRTWLGLSLSVEMVLLCMRCKVNSSVKIWLISSTPSEMYNTLPEKL